jgi:hypothetical protein
MLQRVPRLRACRWQDASTAFDAVRQMHGSTVLAANPASAALLGRLSRRAKNAPNPTPGLAAGVKAFSGCSRPEADKSPAFGLGFPCAQRAFVD